MLCSLLLLRSACPLQSHLQSIGEAQATYKGPACGCWQPLHLAAHLAYAVDAEAPNPAIMLQVSFVPISRFQGDNMFERNTSMSWYKGLILLKALDL